MHKTYGVEVFPHCSALTEVDAQPWPIQGQTVKPGFPAFHRTSVARGGQNERESLACPEAGEVSIDTST